MSPVNILPDSM
uniref:Uncharacterized protein n=1 Tax=Arundo donax TaxID=35708 RepID=A0A0A8YVX3_ARUDO